VGEISGLRRKNWNEERQRFVEQETQKMIAIAGAVYAITARRDGHEAAATEVKRFLYDEAYPDVEYTVTSTRSAIAADLIERTFDSQQALEELLQKR
jgi:hypothetical protein